MVKRELRKKAKLSIYLSVYVPTLAYGPETWIMTKRTRSQMLAAEMSLFCREDGLRDRVRSLIIRERLRV